MSRDARWLAFLVVAGCAPTPESRQAALPWGAAEGGETHAVRHVQRPEIAGSEEGECEAVIAYREGRAPERMCAAEAEQAGLTVVDLSDRWTPGIFAEAPEFGEAGRQPYRETFLALADERYRRSADFDQAREDRYLELYGIFPTLRVLRERMLDDTRHRCHDAVDDAAIGELTTTLRPYRETPDQAAQRLRTAEWLGRRLERARVQRGASSIASLASEDSLRVSVRQYQEMRVPIDAVRAVQAHLECDGLLERPFVEGAFDRPTVRALEQWQRRHMIISWGLLDEETRAAMREDSRELELRAMFRALRERVVDATGIIEDGSAGAEDSGIVLGRHVDPEEIHHVRTYGALPHAAPDLVSRATEAAARALGWTTPEAARAWLAGLREGQTRDLLVALALPEPPAWHDEHMELEVEIDRGDVYYDYPYDATGRRRSQPVERRPTLTLYTEHRGRRIALVRWNTTIGGWQPERMPSGGIAMRYKESQAGERIWRDVIASPAWLPPDSTPPDELVRRRPDGEWAPNQDLFGPGYQSAYGLVMMPHLAPTSRRDGTERLVDHRIRTHGSVAYSSILRGYSHGCHRLFNHLAVRLGSFLLRHRQHVRHGVLDASYARRFHAHGRSHELRIDTRGYRYELTPPVEVTVLPGSIRSRAQEAPRGGRMLPERLREMAAAAAEGTASVSP